jgi:hypothetical protein
MGPTTSPPVIIAKPPFRFNPGDGSESGELSDRGALELLVFPAEFKQHNPPKGSHLIRYYRWYSKKSRGPRKKAGSGSISRHCGPASAGTGRIAAQRPRPGDVDQAGVRSGPAVLP